MRTFRPEQDKRCATSIYAIEIPEPHGKGCRPDCFRFDVNRDVRDVKGRSGDRTAHIPVVVYGGEVRVVVCRAGEFAVKISFGTDFACWFS
jgi:hypothetical protein